MEFACKKNASSLHVCEFVHGVVKGFIKKKLTCLSKISRKKRDHKKEKMFDFTNAWLSPKLSPTIRIPNFV